MTPTRTGFAPSRWIAGTVLATALTAVVSGCSHDVVTRAAPPAAATMSAAPSVAPALASASAGDLTITGGYVPEPASPDVAAAYLTVTNDGAAADTLTGASSDAAATVMAMAEADSGSTGSMTGLSQITVPAHGSMSFAPGQAHLMLEQPRALAAGDRLELSLTFAHAGTVELEVPVLPLTDLPGTTQSR